MKLPTTKTKLNWPLAPYAVLAETDSEQPDCTVMLCNATQLKAKLAIFDPDQGIVAIFSPDGAKLRSIKLGDIKRVQLDQPVTLISSTVMTDVQGITSLPVLQACSVEFKDGAVLKVDTFGVAEITSGIFLYLVSKGNKYVRQFIPFQSIKTYSFGSRLGDMLLNQEIVTGDHLALGLQRQQELRERRLGEYLTEDKIVSPQQLAKTLKDMHNHATS